MLLKPRNVTNIILQNGYILILAIGMVMVIIAGHIDLSVGSVAGFIGAVAAVLMVTHWHSPWSLAVLLCLARRRAWSARGRASGSPTSASRRSSSPSPACCSSAA